MKVGSEFALQDASALAIARNKPGFQSAIIEHEGCAVLDSMAISYDQDSFRTCLISALAALDAAGCSKVL